LALNTGYWIGRRQRPDDNWDWTLHALNEGWLHQNYLNDPDHYSRDGKYIWRD
jgi:hypothetical protein